MADFCKQCADEMFPDIGGEFSHDFEGLTKFGDQMVGLYMCVLCEGCGPIQVDWLGQCISICGEFHNYGSAASQPPDIDLKDFFRIDTTQL